MLHTLPSGAEAGITKPTFVAVLGYSILGVKKTDSPVLPSTRVSVTPISAPSPPTFRFLPLMMQACPAVMGTPSPRVTAAGFCASCALTTP